MWFCHRRLKDRKGTPGSAPPVGEEVVAASEPYREHLSTASTSLSSPFSHLTDPRRLVVRTPGVAVPRISGDLSTMKRYYEPQHSVAELRAIAFVEAQLGEPVREDGPILGMEFDSLPPDAFGAPIGKVCCFFHFSTCNYKTCMLLPVGNFLKIVLVVFLMKLHQYMVCLTLM
ncbi:unnamed protein product [Linum tenue]|uniref:Uncharacterized protein n=1 Tax=Linum tenue TaxID=586396 RepID=A0AAV0HJ46_9ROSI|nr:unnamed protein product [Linum tenue]